MVAVIILLVLATLLLTCSVVFGRRGGALVRTGSSGTDMYQAACVFALLGSIAGFSAAILGFTL